MQDLGLESLDVVPVGADRKEVLSQEASDIRHQKLEKQAAKGTVYIVGYFGISLALRMVSSVVLTRLLSPGYFGLMTLLTTVLVGLNLFSHIGLADSVIQSPRGDEPVFLNTTWTLQALRGIGLWVLTILLAWP
jgi:O-antigen/teichoic acid export membrane protein